jgi:hypothetical protein
MTDPSKTTKMKEQPDPADDPSASVIRRFRLRTADSAFVYAIFEASEGACAYSTLPNEPGDRHRDLELIIPVCQIPEVERILEQLFERLAGEIYELKVDPQ